MSFMNKTFRTSARSCLIIYRDIFIQKFPKHLSPTFSWCNRFIIIRNCGITNQKNTYVCHIILHNSFNRSEEHTSELQSRFDLVCRLLLEKKKLSKKLNV